MRVGYLCKTYLVYVILIFFIIKFWIIHSTPTCEEIYLETTRNESNADKLDKAKIHWAESVIKNFSKSQTTENNWNDLFNAIPHLRHLPPSAIEPIYLLGSKPAKKTMVMAIPAIERPQASYLLGTLQSLIGQLYPDDRHNISIVVFLSNEEGKDSKFVRSAVADIQRQHSQDVADGLLQVVLIPILFYPPNLDKLPTTFNDSARRMYWRTKQNLDYVYSMTYCSQLAEYYLQLEDDIIAGKGYAKNILYFIEIKQDVPWIILEFSSLGCIGKLFRGEDLHLYISMLSMFYKAKPVDWIIEDLYKAMYCSPEWAPKRCREEIMKFRFLYDPIQFQHMGKYSSLKGKIQKLKERSFGAVALKKKRNNPEAEVETSIQERDITHTISNAYKFSAFFESHSPPKRDDFINFVFNRPVGIKTILLTTGNTMNPNMTFNDETKVYLTDGSLQTQQIGQFSRDGRFFIKLAGKPIKKLRVEVHSDLQHCVILEQIAFTL